MDDISKAANRDSLTGASTRSTFNEQLIRQIEQAQRENNSCSLLVFDLDHFKSINDAFGHTRGDEALREIGRQVHNIIRASDLFFRYGGDEFTVILPDTTKAEATELAERLLDSIRSQPIDNESLKVTLSIGVATFPEDAQNDQTLFEKADARNYEAKRRGRARVVAEESDPSAELPFAEISRLIERDDGLEGTKNFLASLREHSRGVLSIAGTAGTGRSRFLQEVEKLALLQGFEIISLHATQRLKTKPYGVLEATLQEFSPPLHSPIENFNDAVQGLLTLSKRDYILICVDDLPHLDWGTLDLLRQLLSSSTFSILGLVYVSEPESVRVAAPFWAPVLEQVTLRPFSSGGLRIWLRMLMQWEVPEDFILWLEKQTHNIPLQVEQVLKYLLKHGGLIRQDSNWVLHEAYQAIASQGFDQWQKRVIPNNLPAALTSFVGRDAELGEVRRLLASTRLLTVVGAGGMGKTRLTLQVAKDALNGFKDGIWLLELAPISDPALAMYAIASVLGVHEEQSRPLMETLSTWLRDKELLFILDNCEHLVDLCAQFAHDVLVAAPNVRILASSREALDVAGELIYRMPALEAPQPEMQFDIEQLKSYTAVQLFLERAAFAETTFSITNENASSIAHICRHLDGIPLAIELAAARLKSLSLEEISTGLDDRFALLTKGNRGALPRQQTLRSLVDWSYDMLPSAERSLLQRLSVFSGGWTLEAAEHICVDEGNMEIKLSEVFSLLKRLADKSLINMDDRSSEPRYHMLETIRQYAHEKLLESHEQEGIRDQHLNYYLKFAEQAEPVVMSADRHTTVQRLEMEYDNLSVALECASEKNIQAAQMLAGSLGWFWYFGDHLNEGRVWCLRILELGDKTESIHAIAKLLGTAGMISSNLGYNEEARAWLEQSMAKWKSLDERLFFAQSMFWLAYTLVQLGEDEMVCELFTENEETLRFSHPLIQGWSLSYWGRALENAHGNFSAAKRFHEESLALGNKMQDINVLGTAHMNLGYWASKQGDYAAAHQYHLQSQEWHRKDGARLRIAISLHNMADMLSLQGKYEQAQTLYIESLSLSRALGDQAFIAWTAYRLGYLAIHLKEYPRALEFFTESLKLYRGQAEQELITSCLAGCAELQRAQGRLLEAARLLGYVSAHPQSAQRMFLLVIDSIEYDHSLEALRRELVDVDFDTAWEEGSNMKIMDAIDLAINAQV